jgi:hypothetical protein
MKVISRAPELAFDNHKNIKERHSFHNYGAGELGKGSSVYAASAAPLTSEDHMEVGPHPVDLTPAAHSPLQSTRASMGSWEVACFAGTSRPEQTLCQESAISILWSEP